MLQKVSPYRLGMFKPQHGDCVTLKGVFVELLICPAKYQQTIRISFTLMSSMVEKMTYNKTCKSLFSCLCTLSQKTCYFIFDDSQVKNCQTSTILGTLINQIIGHQKTVAFSHRTYLVQLSYLRKLSSPKSQIQPQTADFPNAMTFTYQ